MTINTMEELLKEYGSKIKGFKKSQKIEAKVVEINKKSALFDIGGKSEGVLKDTYFQEARDFLKTLKAGDVVHAVVMDSETSEGHVLLSLRHAASDSLWEKFKDLKNKGTVISVAIKNSNPAGISVDYEGINGFIPSSQIGRDTLKNIDSMGNSLRVKVIEVDKNRKKVVFSEKEVSEAKEMKQIEDALKAVEIGKTYKGEIVTVTDFGVFVKISVNKTEVEGLVHVSESAWEKIDKPSDIFKVGQLVEVKVLGTKDGRLSLSIKQTQLDPWDSVVSKLKVDDKVTGKVLRSSDFGVFVEVAHGVEGLIHITKIPPATHLAVGDVVNCYIEEIDNRNKKIALGLILSTKPLNYK